VLEAFVADPSGRRLLRSRMAGPKAHPHELGRNVAQNLLDAGGRQIVDDLEKDRDKGDVTG